MGKLILVAIAGIIAGLYLGVVIAMVNHVDILSKALEKAYITTHIGGN